LKTKEEQLQEYREFWSKFFTWRLAVAILIVTAFQFLALDVMFKIGVMDVILKLNDNDLPINKIYIGKLVIISIFVTPGFFMYLLCRKFLITSPVYALLHLIIFQHLVACVLIYLKEIRDFSIG
jgi:hypothetical protein